MAKRRFVDPDIRSSIAVVVRATDHATLGTWAADCAERVIHLFEREHPGDGRPRRAITDLRDWVLSGTFRMADVRRASLDAHAAAREAGEDAARFAGRACGQALATAHVPTHSIAAAWYAAKAVWAADPENAAVNVASEREWQHRRLLELRESPVPTGKDVK